MHEVETMIHPLEGAEGIRPRRFLRAATIVVALLVILVGNCSARPLWQTAWNHFFPPPPYTGTSIYGFASVRTPGAGTDLVALRTRDGRESWRINDVASGQPILATHDRLYLLNLKQTRLRAIRAADGFTLWSANVDASLGQGATMFALGMTTASIIVQEQRANPVGSHPIMDALVALDRVDGRTRWVQPLLREDFVFLRYHQLIISETSADLMTQTEQISVSSLDISTGITRWKQQFDSTGYGVGCRAGNATLVLCLAGARSGEFPRTIMRAFDSATGQPIWNRTLDDAVVSHADATTIIATTNLTGRLTTLPVTISVYDLATGVLRWQTTGDFGAMTEMTTGAPYQLWISDATGYTIFDGDTGAPIHHQVMRFAKDTAIVLPTPNAFYGANQAGIFGDILTDRPRFWQDQTPSNGSPFLALDDHALYISDQQRLRAIDAATGQPLWSIAQAISPFVIA